MSAQLTYNIYQGIRGYNGYLADLNPEEVVAKAVETVAGILPGRVVSRGTDKEKQIVIGGVLADVLGITIRNIGLQATTIPALATDVPYSVTDMASVLRSGYIYIEYAGVLAVVAGTEARYDVVTGELHSGAAPIAGDIAALTGSQWQTDNVAGEIAILRIKL